MCECVWDGGTGGKGAIATAIRGRWWWWCARRDALEGRWSRGGGLLIAATTTTSANRTTSCISETRDETPHGWAKLRHDMGVATATCHFLAPPRPDPTGLPSPKPGFGVEGGGWYGPGGIGRDRGGGGGGRWGAHRGRRAPIGGGGRPSGEEGAHQGRRVYFVAAGWLVCFLASVGLELVFIDFHTLRDLH